MAHIEILFIPQKQKIVSDFFSFSITGVTGLNSSAISDCKV